MFEHWCAADDLCDSSAHKSHEIQNRENSMPLMSCSRSSSVNVPTSQHDAEMTRKSQTADRLDFEKYFIRFLADEIFQKIAWATLMQEKIIEIIV
jgi:hypothetical protein